MNNDLRLSNLVKGKQVLLVGNSASLLQSNSANLIDSYEYVIRFNLAIGHFHSYNIGKKCSAWVFAMMRKSVVQSTYRSAQIKPETCVRYGERVELDVPYLILDVSKNQIAEEIGIGPGIHPSTGLVTAWYMINRARPASLSLIGFDSFTSKNFYQNRHALETIRTVHNPLAEQEYLARQAENRALQFVK